MCFSFPPLSSPRHKENLLTSDTRNRTSSSPSNPSLPPRPITQPPSLRAPLTPVKSPAIPSPLSTAKKSAEVSMR